MREIEIKARIADKASILKKLEGQGVTLGAPVKQHDVVYSLPGAQDNAFDACWLRIRTENDQKIIFTLKRSVVGHLDSIEHEVVVDNADELEAIIKLLGFELYSDLTKIRRKGVFGAVEVCLDELPGLGTFIEAEKVMQHDADHDEVESELWELFKSLGINMSDQETRGYDVLERAQRLS